MIIKLLFLIPTLVFSYNVSVETTHLTTVNKTIQANAKIIQLSAQKQIIFSPLKGELLRYYVKSNQPIKKGDQIALIQSKRLYKITQDYLKIKNKVKTLKTQKNITQRLFNKGLISKKSLTKSKKSLTKILIKQKNLERQLRQLNLLPKSITKTTDRFKLYAKSKGTVEKILLPIHSTLHLQTPIIQLVNHNNSYYALAYLNIKDSFNISSMTQGIIEINHKNYELSFIKFYPSIDEKRQKAQALFQIINRPKHLFLKAIFPINLSTPLKKKAIIIKKSALSHFQGELVIFIRDKKIKHYRPQVVKVQNDFGEFVSIEGVEENLTYVKEGTYYIKSLLINSLFDRVKQ